MPQPFETLRYENSALWDPLQWAGQAADIRRARLVLAALPPGVKTVLDVGCGNGLLARENQQGYQITSLERSWTALQEASGARCQADAARIPFIDRAFDAVVALEVIEHLPLQTYRSALVELARLSRSCILITVPYCEVLDHSHVICPDCGSRFHPYFHLRSFTKSTLTGLFQAQGWHCVRLEGLEGIRTRRMPALWNLIRLFYHRDGSNFPAQTLCPVCGYSRPLPKGTSKDGFTTRRKTGWKRALAGIWPTAASFQWWLAVYSH